ncbi:MAG: chalcone isomerase family protein [Granulosicoccus sp.]
MIRTLFVIFMLVAVGNVHAAKVAGVELQESVSAGETELVLNGAGLRKKLFFKLYVGSLYVKQAMKGANAESLVQADESMLIQLDILSDLLTRDKLIKALNDGFDKSTGGNIAPVEEQVSIMIESLNQPITPGDIYRIMYTPESGTTVMVGDQTLATLEGLPFKQAVFGIWLSKNPVQSSLKQAMLAQ